MKTTTYKCYNGVCSTEAEACTVSCTQDDDEVDNVIAPQLPCLWFSSMFDPLWRREGAVPFKWTKIEEPTDTDLADDRYGWFDSLRAVGRDTQCPITDLEFIQEEAENEEEAEMNRIASLMEQKGEVIFSREKGKHGQVGYFRQSVFQIGVIEGSMVYEVYAVENPSGGSSAYVRKAS